MAAIHMSSAVTHSMYDIICCTSAWFKANVATNVPKSLNPQQDIWDALPGLLQVIHGMNQHHLPVSLAFATSFAEQAEFLPQ